MRSPELDRLLQRKMSRKEFLVFSGLAAASIFGVSRVLSELKSHATGVPTAFEPEDGMLASGASLVDNVSASGGKGVKFGSGATPTPSPDFVLGTTKPNASNTASFADGELAVHNGDLTITTSGTAASPYIVENLEIRGFVKIQGAYVIIRNCRIVGRNSRYYTASMIDMTAAGTGCRVEYSEITSYANDQDNSRYWLNGIGDGDDWTIYRCNIHDVVDAIDVSGDNGRIQGCYIHDLTLRTDDADHANDTWKPYWTHNDGVQFTGGNNWLIEGNNFEMTFSQVSGMVGNPSAPSIASDNTLTPGNHGSAAKGQAYWPNMHGILYQAKSANFSNIKTNNNWFSGGTYLLQANASGTTYATGNTATFSGNRIYVGQTIFNDGTGLATQFTMSGTVGTYDGLLGTIYANDDPGVTASWRGHTVQPPSGGGPSGNYKYNPALVP